MQTRAVGVFQCISSEVFVPCLVDLCKALWELMKSYHRTIDWHRHHDDAMATQAPANAAAADADSNAGLCYSVSLPHTHSFNDHFPGKPGLAGCPR